VYCGAVCHGLNYRDYLPCTEAVPEGCVSDYIRFDFRSSLTACCPESRSGFSWRWRRDVITGGCWTLNRGYRSLPPRLRETFQRERHKVKKAAVA